jgi:hypothetical protein
MEQPRRFGAIAQGMPKMRVVVVACLLLVASAAARAQSDAASANSVTPGCHEYLDRATQSPAAVIAFDEGVCIGFVSGVWDNDRVAL